jgi:hypothetical protein
MKLLTRFRIWAILLFAVLAAGALWWGWYRPLEAHYLGKPTARWAEEILATRSVGVDESGHMVWYNNPSQWEQWWARLGGPRPDWYRQPAVLSGDPAAAAVLAELLRHPEPKVRVTAAVTLRKQAGEWRPTLTEIVETVGTNDVEARQYAEVCLRRFDVLVRGLEN